MNKQKQTTTGPLHFSQILTNFWAKTAEIRPTCLLCSSPTGPVPPSAIFAQSRSHLSRVAIICAIDFLFPGFVLFYYLIQCHVLNSAMSMLLLLSILLFFKTCENKPCNDDGGKVTVSSSNCRTNSHSLSTLTQRV